jgi:hypothetical protein
MGSEDDSRPRKQLSGREGSKEGKEVEKRGGFLGEGSVFFLAKEWWAKEWLEEGRGGFFAPREAGGMQTAVMEARKVVLILGALSLSSGMGVGAEDCGGADRQTGVSIVLQSICVGTVWGEVGAIFRGACAAGFSHTFQPSRAAGPCMRAVASSSPMMLRVAGSMVRLRFT